MLKRGYIILIVGAVMLVTAVVISALSAGSFAGQFMRDNIIISHATIRPSESVTEVLQVNDTRRQVSLALHSEAESTNATIRATIRDPISKIVNAKEFPKDYFTTFKPNSTGNYTLTLTNLGNNIINIDGVFGFLAICWGKSAGKFQSAHHHNNRINIVYHRNCCSYNRCCNCHSG